MNGKFRNTKVGQWILKEAPAALDIIGTAYPPAGVITGIVKHLLPAANVEANPEFVAAISAYEETDYKAYLADVSDARDREVKINESSNSSWLSKNVSSLIAVFVLTLTGTVFTLAITKAVDVRDNLTLMVITSLSNATMIVLGYYFGSSKQSGEREKVINDMLKSN